MIEERIEERIEEKVEKRSFISVLLRVILPILLMPCVIIIGNAALGERSHFFVSTAVACLSVAVFFGGFREQKHRGRRGVIVAIMTALSVVGRLFPIFKPVSALVVISATYLGAEAGFTVGALSALISNFIFGQGPWTPFQMLACGIIGLLAGILAKPLQRSRLALVVYGVGAGILYSLIVDVWTVLAQSGRFDLQMYGAAAVTALPSTALYALTNAVFLYFMAKPFKEKLGRVKIKYGI